MGDFRQLVAWQESRKLALLSRGAIAALPRSEQYALASQWRRAAYSVALNIAEGAGQVSRKQFVRYLNIALGSLDELQGVLELADAMGYLSGATLEELRKSRLHCVRLVAALVRRLREPE